MIFACSTSAAQAKLHVVFHNQAQCPLQCSISPAGFIFRLELTKLPLPVAALSTTTTGCTPHPQCSIDGAYFGTTFPHLMLMTYPVYRPPKSNEKYVPRVFGFKLHPSAITNGANGGAAAGAGPSGQQQQQGQGQRAGGPSAPGAARLGNAGAGGEEEEEEEEETEQQQVQRGPQDGGGVGAEHHHQQQRQLREQGDAGGGGRSGVLRTPDGSSAQAMSSM